MPTFVDVLPSFESSLFSFFTIEKHFISISGEFCVPDSSFCSLLDTKGLFPHLQILWGFSSELKFLGHKRTGLGGKSFDETGNKGVGVKHEKLVELSPRWRIFKGKVLVSI